MKCGICNKEFTYDDNPEFYAGSFYHKGYCISKIKDPDDVRIFKCRSCDGLGTIIGTKVITSENPCSCDIIIEIDIKCEDCNGIGLFKQTDIIWDD